MWTPVVGEWVYELATNARGQVVEFYGGIGSCTANVRFADGDRVLRDDQMRPTIAPGARVREKKGSLVGDVIARVDKYASAKVRWTTEVIDTVPIASIEPI